MKNTRISRSTAVYKILNSKGRMFSVKWKTNAGRDKKLNGKLSKVSSDRLNQDKIFGYVTVWNNQKKQHRRVNTRTITELRIDKKKYRVR